VFLSAHRFKTDIADMATASEAILALRPVTFHYKPELDKTGIPQFGLVAEEVEAINPDLVTRDREGKVSTVRYDQVNAMLLNEFLKEHRKVQEQDRKISEQETTIKGLRKEMQTVLAHLKEQDSKIQKVTDQLKMDKPAPQVAAIK
jgi:endosialidase-like protein